MKAFILSLFFGLSLSLTAQESFTIRGVVVDRITQQPLEGVNIVGARSAAVSDAKGAFLLEVPTRRVYRFLVTYVGYAESLVTVDPRDADESLLIALEPEVTSLDEVELFGKTPQQKAQELSAISVGVSKAFLENNRENSLMQTLKKIPGVSTITIGSGQSKPVIRGLGFNRVSVVQNGIKHEAQQWGNDHGLEIDQYAVEDLQIIKGPASLLYGSDAIGGIVDIRPPKIPAAQSFGAEVNLASETNNDLVSVSSGFQGRGEQWYYRGRLTYRDYGDYRVPTDRINYESYVFELFENQLRNTAGSEANASFSIGYVNDAIKSETLISNVNAQNGFFANAHGLEVRTSNIDYDRSDRDVDLPFHQVNHFKLIHNTTLYKKAHTLQFDLGYQNNQREEHSEAVAHGYMPVPPNTRERVFTKNTFSLNAQDTFKPDADHDISIGVNTEFQKNQIGGWGFLIPAYTRFTAGVFAFDHYRVNQDLHIQGGLRYDWGLIQTEEHFDWYRSVVNNADQTTSLVFAQRARNRELDFGNFSASMGMSYRINYTTLKVNVGKSFRMPLANELASDGVNYHMYRFERGAIDLDSEESYQIDVDIDHAKGSFVLGLSPFLNYFDNFIYLNPTTEYYQTLQIYQYMQTRAIRFGGEAWIGENLTHDLRFDASIEYVYAEQTSGPKKGFTLPFNPPLSGLISLSQTLRRVWFVKEMQLMADLRLTAAQNRIVPPEEKTPGYQLLNLSLNTQFKWNASAQPARIRLKVNNVLNTQFFDHTSFYRLIDVPEPGRNIALALNLPI